MFIDPYLAGILTVLGVELLIAVIAIFHAAIKYNHYKHKGE